MRIIVGCEESQVVTIELRKLGHAAFSCDLKPCSGGHPEWHLQMDVFKAISAGYLKTQAGNSIYITNWEVGIFHPDCTFLTVSANKWLKDQPKRKSGALVGAERREARTLAIEFFMKLYNCQIPNIAMENPIGCMSSEFRKPDQIIQPWMFGDDASKSTCLWVRGLPALKVEESNFYPPRITDEGKKRWSNQCDKGGDNVLPPSADRAELRSKTYPGIAKAMAEQWTSYLKQKELEKYL